MRFSSRSCARQACYSRALINRLSSNSFETTPKLPATSTTSLPRVAMYIFVIFFYLSAPHRWAKNCLELSVPIIIKTVSSTVKQQVPWQDIQAGPNKWYKSQKSLKSHPSGLGDAEYCRSLMPQYCNDVVVDWDIHGVQCDKGQSLYPISSPVGLSIACKPSPRTLLLSLIFRVL